MDLLESSVETHGRPLQLEGEAGAISGFVATPGAGAWKSTVVVIGDGIDPHVCAACRDLAAGGHGALAIDLPLADLERTIAEDRAQRRPPAARFTADVRTALAFLRAAAPSPPRRSGVVGYGAGGLVALAAGYRYGLGVAVCLYGEGLTLLRTNLTQLIPEPKRHAAPFVCLVGAEDAGVQPRDLREIGDHLDRSRVDHTFILYPGTGAGFCRPGHAGYRPSEASDAWGRVVHSLEAARRERHRYSRVAH